MPLLITAPRVGLPQLRALPCWPKAGGLPGAPSSAARGQPCSCGLKACVPWLECLRRPGSAGSCQVTVTLLSGLWLLFAVVGPTGFYRSFSQGRQRARGCPGEPCSSPKPHFGMFFFFLGGWGMFCFWIPTLRVTFTSLIGLLPNKKKSLLTNGKPCTSASSALQFNCFKERPCVVLS